MQNVYLRDYRCEHCKKLFFKAEILNATIQIKCKSCKNMSVFKAEECPLRQNSMINDGLIDICNNCFYSQKCAKNSPY